MKKYMSIWFIVSLWVAFEFWALSGHSSFSTLLKLQAAGYIRSDLKINTDPGRALSLWLGYIGFSLMVVMNLYTFRKKFAFTQNWGRLSSWLNFHIFCGLLGPTLIIFHCNLKVRGLVGISFWSMVVSFSSGIIGRYFFAQILKIKADYEKTSELQLQDLDKLIGKFNVVVTPDFKNKVLNDCFRFVGGQPNQTAINPISALVFSIFADTKMLFKEMPLPAGWPVASKYSLTQYALNKRRAQFFVPYQKLMGYWHAFHFPFAVFMYIAAVIHILSSLIFVNTK